uniref:lysophosphatidic acid phosphatase type 6 isoform X2 n=1 Tax=Myxine glutinosa TaxID=7769 RepID=UPI00358E853A
MKKMRPKQLNHLGVAVTACGALVCVWLARNRVRGPLVEEVRRNRGTTSDTRTRGLDLRQAVVLFRHGARTPLTVLPYLPEVQWNSDLLQTPSYTLFDYVTMDEHGVPRSASTDVATLLPNGVPRGELTRIGMEQAYHLGLHLRDLYIHQRPLLSPSFKSQEIYIRSTDTKRTIESARCVLAGLFLQKQEEPAKIVVARLEEEVLFPNYICCARLKELLRMMFGNSHKLPDLLKDKEALHALLHLPVDSRGPDFIALRDVLVARQTHGLPVSLELHDWLPKVEQRATQMMLSGIGTEQSTEVLQLSSGPLLNLILQNMEEIVEGKKSPQLLLYSCHDTTLLPLLPVLGIWGSREKEQGVPVGEMKPSAETWPPFAASLCIDLLHEAESGKHFVQVSYLNQPFRLPGCTSEPCPWSEFHALLAPFALSVQEYAKKCVGSDAKPTAEPNAMTQ